MGSLFMFDRGTSLLSSWKAASAIQRDAVQAQRAREIKESPNLLKRMSVRTMVRKATLEELTNTALCDVLAPVIYCHRLRQDVVLEVRRKIYLWLKLAIAWDGAHRQKPAAKAKGRKRR